MENNLPKIYAFFGALLPLLSLAGSTSLKFRILWLIAASPPGRAGARLASDPTMRKNEVKGERQIKAGGHNQLIAKRISPTPLSLRYYGSTHI